MSRKQSLPQLSPDSWEITVRLPTQRDVEYLEMALAPESLPQSPSPWRRAWRKLWRSWSSRLAMFFLFILAFLGGSASWNIKHWIYFTPEEKHPYALGMGPGSRSIPLYYVQFGPKSPKIFAQVDKDGNESISAQELVEYLALQNFYLLDKDGNHKLSKQELDRFPSSFWVSKLGLTQERFLGRVEKVSQRAFLDLDLDHNGLVQDEEIAEGWSCMGWSLPAKSKIDLQHFVQSMKEDLNRRCGSKQGRCEFKFEDIMCYTMPLGITQAAQMIHRTDLNGDQHWQWNEFPGIPKMKTHLLGTDQQGRDILSRLFTGLKRSLLLTAGVVLSSIVLGVFGAWLWTLVFWKRDDLPLEAWSYQKSLPNIVHGFMACPLVLAMLLGGWKTLPMLACFALIVAWKALPKMRVQSTLIWTAMPDVLGLDKQTRWKQVWIPLFLNTSLERLMLDGPMIILDLLVLNILGLGPHLLTLEGIIGLGIRHQQALQFMLPFVILIAEVAALDLLARHGYFALKQSLERYRDDRRFH